MGPLEGVKVLELAGIGPGPFCGMMLADMGADVVRVDRIAGDNNPLGIPTQYDLPSRNKRSIAVDLKSPQGIETILRLVESADALIDPFRPGVAERLGIGPDACSARNARLVYGRITGWGQTGPLSQRAGHDLNYVALSGALHAMGNKDTPPAIPLNLVGDYGGGAMYLAFGITCALLEARRSGQGQVIDAAMLDGITSLMGPTYGYAQCGVWNEERGTNLLDGSAPFYSVYETSDGHYVTVGPIEPRFYMQMVTLLGVEPGNQYDRATWPERKEMLTALFRTKTRAEWDALLADTDACYAPVMSIGEAPQHPHNVERNIFQTHFGVLQPATAPRFSRTEGSIRTAPPEIGENSRDVLVSWGMSNTQADAAISAGHVLQR